MTQQQSPGEVPPGDGPPPQAAPYHGPTQSGPWTYQGQSGYQDQQGYQGQQGQPSSPVQPTYPGQYGPAGYSPSYPPQGYPIVPAVVPMSDSDARLWSTLSHVGMMLTGFLAPLIIWSVFKDRSPLVRHHAAAATNFGFLVSIGYAASALLVVTFVLALVSPFAIIAILVVALVFGITAATRANRGEYYNYPFNVTWLK